MVAREHHADADELARHRIFIEGIENPLWTEI
jgi:DNA polymerase-3 subunit epsilon